MRRRRESVQLGWLTTNSSYAVGGGGNFNLRNDMIRIDFAAIYAGHPLQVLWARE